MDHQSLVQLSLERLNGPETALYCFKKSPHFRLVDVAIRIQHSEGNDNLLSSLLITLPPMFNMSKLPYLSLVFESPRFDNYSNACQPFSAKKENIVSEPEFLHLSHYCFPPNNFVLEQLLDFHQIVSLELVCCKNIGFLFNSMLRTSCNLNLKFLRICDSTNPSADKGYQGCEKLECFLSVYKGLEELVVCNMGGDFTCLAKRYNQRSTMYE